MRVRVWDVLPDTHALHADQSLTTQSTGSPHSSVLHGWVSLRLPQLAPPFAAGVAIVRVRVWLPPPHCTEQSSHALHALAAQSTGHSVSRDSDSDGHAAPPPDAGTVTVRVRVWLVLPAVHADHALQSLTSQFTGVTHVSVLQSWVSTSDPHPAPPPDAGVVTERVRSCVPPPHSAEQVLQALQAPASQSTAGAEPVHGVEAPGQMVVPGK